MTPRDPAAAARLDHALQPAAARVRAARQQTRTSRLWAETLAGVLPHTLALATAMLVASLWLEVPLWLGPLLLALTLGARALRLASRRPAVATTLADGAQACDRANDNKDRLGAALELAAAPAGEHEGDLHRALAQAAVDDGVRSLQRVDLTRIDLAYERTEPAWRRTLACAVALALLPLILPAHGSEPDVQRTATRPAGPAAAAQAPNARNAPETPPSVASAPGARGERTDEARTGEKRAQAPPPRPAEQAAAVPAASGVGVAGTEAASESTQSGSPRAAPAGNPGTGQSGGGQGASASGAPQPLPTADRPKPPSKPKKPQARDPHEQRQGKPHETAGAPSGPARGSGKASPTGNKANDTSRGQEREDEPEIEDEPVEDETDEQEQRGGVMPMRRGDNRPAARELSISGDGPPDQGRGGPTPPKKARGTASLVLGLRLPDSVRGQPNPGTAKTSLEQIPPRPSDAALGPAHAAPAGRPTTPQSTRRPAAQPPLHQAYHAFLRAQDRNPSPSSAPQDSSR